MGLALPREQEALVEVIGVRGLCHLVVRPKEKVRVNFIVYSVRL